MGGPVDEVRLVLVNRADHPTPTLFQDGQQTWSFSLSDLSFDYGEESDDADDQVASFGPQSGSESSASLRKYVELARSNTGDLILKASAAFAN